MHGQHQRGLPMPTLKSFRPAGQSDPDTPKAMPDATRNPQPGLNNASTQPHAGVSVPRCLQRSSAAAPSSTPLQVCAREAGADPYPTPNPTPTVKASGGTSTWASRSDSHMSEGVAWQRPPAPGRCKPVAVARMAGAGPRNPYKPYCHRSKRSSGTSTSFRRSGVHVPGSSAAC